MPDKKKTKEYKVTLRFDADTYAVLQEYAKVKNETISGVLRGHYDAKLLASYLAGHLKTKLDRPLASAEDVKDYIDDALLMKLDIQKAVQIGELLDEEIERLMDFMNSSHNQLVKKLKKLK